MKQKCFFNKVADIMETRQGLGVVIPASLDSHQIVDTTSPSSYNGQTKLSDVGHRISEPFDVIEYDRAYTQARAKVLKDKD